MTRVLVTGATGFVGAPCVAGLVARGHEVHAVSRHAGVADVAWHEVDVLDTLRMADLVRRVRPTHLLHLAWDVTPGVYLKSESNWQWVDASLALLRAFGSATGQRAVMIGTCAEYDPTAGYCIEGRTMLKPATIYGACKAALSLLLPAYGEQVGLHSTAWGRLFFL